MRIVEGLRGSLEGAELCEQIERGGLEHASIRTSVDQAFVDFAHTVLQKYIRQPHSDPATRVKAILVQQRLGAIIGRPSESLQPAPRGVDTGQFQHQVASLLWAKTGPIQAPGRRAGERGNGISKGGHNGKTRRLRPLTDSELIKTRDELERLQSQLGRRLDQALSQNLDFVAQLKGVQDAVRNASRSDDLAALQRLLLQSAQELIDGHRRLDGNLRTAGEDLKAMKGHHRSLHHEMQRVRDITLTDEFTGMPNRAAFLRRLEAEAGRAQRYGYPLALAIIDPDRFENIRTYIGPAAGEAVLRCYAKQVLCHFRAYDTVARYGHDEFAVLLPNTGQDQAVSALRKVQSRVNGVHYHYSGKTLSVPTFCSGLTWYKPGESTANLLDRAGYALNRAKSAGTNRIETIAPTH